MKKKLIAIIGPTACGKTALALHIAQHFPVDIVSVDSAMIYRDMCIGTAKPSKAELAIAPHRLIDLCDPTQNYSAGQFCADALHEIECIISSHRVPLLVGGTMLYFHQLFFGLAELPTADKTIRKQLSDEAEKIGWIAMHEKLRNVDPVAAARIKPQDSQRIQRALEVFALTGKPISELQKKSESTFLTNYDVLMIGLMPIDRAWLHERIARRFDKMLEMDFIEEVRRLHARYDLHLNLPSMRVVGYRQVWEYLDGKMDFETMKAKAIAATRQLAKRQMTWLRSWPQKVMLLDPKDPHVMERVCKMIGDQ